MPSSTRMRKHQKRSCPGKHLDDIPAPEYGTPVAGFSVNERCR